MATHGFGGSQLCQLLAPQMRELERGDIVAISSVSTSHIGPRALRTWPSGPWKRSQSRCRTKSGSMGFG